MRELPSWDRRVESNALTLSLCSFAVPDGSVRHPVGVIYGSRMPWAGNPRRSVPRGRGRWNGEEGRAGPRENGEEDNAEDQAHRDEPFLGRQERFVRDRGELFRERRLRMRRRALQNGRSIQGLPVMIGGCAPWKKSHEIASPIQMMKPKRLTA